MRRKEVIRIPIILITCLIKGFSKEKRGEITFSSIDSVPKIDFIKPIIDFFLIERKTSFTIHPIIKITSKVDDELNTIKKTHSSKPIKDNIKAESYVARTLKNLI